MWKYGLALICPDVGLGTISFCLAELDIIFSGVLFKETYEYTFTSIKVYGRPILTKEMQRIETKKDFKGNKTIGQSFKNQ